MKIVSYKVAQAIKKAGYPQECNVHISYYDKDGQYHYGSQIGAPKSSFHGTVYAPTYLDVWLWLWREKKTHIEFGDMVYKIYDATEWVDGYGYHLIDLSNKVVNDPEEAIISAIRYLVDNDLIK